MSKRRAFNGVDHFVWAAPRMEDSIQKMKHLLGVEARPGGEHPGHGTHNALIALDGRCYIELLSPLPTQMSRSPLAIALAEAEGLFHWAVATSDLDCVGVFAHCVGLETSRIEGSRNTRDGQSLRWRLLFISGHPYGAALPFFIDWGSTPHPSTTAPKGGTFNSLEVLHPEAEALSRLYTTLGLATRAAYAQSPSINAVIGTTRGPVTLSSPATLSRGIEVTLRRE